MNQSIPCVNRIVKLSTRNILIDYHLSIIPIDGFNELMHSCKLKEILTRNPEQEFVAKLFALCEFIVKKHIAFGYMTGISSTLKIIMNGEFNLCCILKASNINSKMRIVFDGFMKCNRKFVDVQYIRSIIQNNFLLIFLRVRVSCFIYADLNTMYRYFVKSF